LHEKLKHIQGPIKTQYKQTKVLNRALTVRPKVITIS